MNNIFVKNTVVHFILKGNNYEVKNENLLTTSKFYVKISERGSKIAFSFAEISEGKVVEKIYHEFPEHFLFGPTGEFLFSEEEKEDFLIQLCFKLEGIYLYKNERGWVVA